MNTLRVGSLPCGCESSEHDPRFVALTGGPGAGKTAVLELATRLLCEHVAILPESAGIVIGGGFPRHESLPGRTAMQRAIFNVQSELERLVREERRVAIALCDRGTPDGAAYWPTTEGTFWAGLGTSRDAEFERYAAVIHLETPLATEGYDHSNPLRTEKPEEARALDTRIREVWARHPRRRVVSSGVDFLAKARTALDIVRAELPSCCRSHDLSLEGPHASAGGDDP